MSAEFDVVECRRLFPSLRREIAATPVVFFDGPGGSQVPQAVIDAVGRYLAEINSNHGGVFATSQASDAMLIEAGQAVADFVGTDDPDTVVFGANMTTLTLALSRALARTWSAGDQVIVTQLDHDANYTPWVLAADDAGAIVRCVRIRPEDCTLDLDDLEAKLSARTRLVAVCCASNAVGTLPPIAKIIEMAHAVGAQVALDAVHYAPHALIDVKAWSCDYLVCSAYKFFGPHVGILWGKRELLSALRPYKLRPAPEALPGRWMTGTQNHEGIAGTLAAVEYLADLGRRAVGANAGRRAALAAAFDAIGEYERALTARLIHGLGEIPDVRIWGITDPARLNERTPTVSITHARHRPIEIARYLAERGIFVWCGNFYALALTEALGLEPDGVTRIGLLHYNTIEEIDRLLAALRAI